MRQLKMTPEEIDILRYLKIKQLDKEVYMLHRDNQPFQTLIEATPYTNIEFVKRMNCISDRIFNIRSYGFKQYKKLIRIQEKVLLDSYMDPKEVKLYINFMKGEYPWVKRIRVEDYDLIIARCLGILEEQGIEKIYLSPDVVI